MNQKYITVKEAAKYLQTSYSRLNELRGRGAGPAYYREGYRIFYAMADLEAYREGNRVEPTGGES